MLLSDKQHQQIHFYLLVLFCFFFPLIPPLAVASVIFLTLNAGWSGLLWQNRRQAFSRWPLLLVAFFCLHLLGMLYTSNWSEGLMDLESKLSFLLLPPVLFAVPLTHSRRRQVLLAFVAGCTAATLYAYSCASLLYFQTGLNAFFYEYLSGYLHSHPSYLAIYLIFCVFIVLENWWEKKTEISIGEVSLRLLLVVHFMIFIFLLTARMQLLICLVLLSIALVVYMAAHGKLGKGILALGVFVGLTAGGMWSVPTTKVRLLNAYQQLSDPTVEPNVRIPIWKVGKELVSQAPLFGQGTGDVQDNLLRLYQRDQITRAIKSNYNCHNQYLQTTIALGVLGLLLLLAGLFWPLFVAIRQGEYLYVLFLSILILSMITECVFEMQKGILFYTFFSSLLALRLVDHKVAQ